MKEITIAATLENIPSVTDFVNQELEGMDCSMKVVMQMDIAIDELFSNIARYAYAPNTGEATVQVEAVKAPRAVSVTFIDRGTPYNPLAKADPDTTLSAEEREIGGLGIFITKKTMDTVSYAYENGENILTMIKKI